jgi:pantoate kinase
LAAGLGGGAVLLALAGIWGVNQASKARARGAENLAQSYAHSIDQLAALTIAERNSRENWQVANSPTIRQYVDVQTGAGAFSGSTSNALATAIALNQNNGLNSAIGGCNYLRVARVSGSRLCGCDTCEG